MNYRFKNARLLINKKDSHSFDIKKGELWTSGNIISFLGNKEEAEEEIKNRNINFDEEIDCEGNLLMPGFKNAHTHTAMTCTIRMNLRHLDNSHPFILIIVFF